MYWGLLGLFPLLWGSGGTQSGCRALGAICLCLWVGKGMGVSVKAQPGDDAHSTLECSWKACKGMETVMCKEAALRTWGCSSGTFLLQCLSPCAIPVHPGTQGQEKPCPFPVVPEALLRIQRHFRTSPGSLEAPGSLSHGKSRLGPSNRPRLPNYPLPVSVCACAAP